jgi:hypothetical protein
MIRHELVQAKDKDLVGSLMAMRRGAAMAFETVVQTNTAIVTVRDNLIARLTADESRKRGIA